MRGRGTNSHATLESRVWTGSLEFESLVDRQFDARRPQSQPPRDERQKRDRKGYHCKRTKCREVCFSITLQHVNSEVVYYYQLNLYEPSKMTVHFKFINLAIILLYLIFNISVECKILVPFFQGYKTEYVHKTELYIVVSPDCFANFL